MALRMTSAEKFLNLRRATVTLVALAWIGWSSFAQQPKNLTATQTKNLAVPKAVVDAVITDIKGSNTSVTHIRAHRYDGCKGMMYYAGVSTETDTYWDSIFLSVAADRYRVSIPLDIIKNVKREPPQENGRSSQPSQQWTVVLSDDTMLVGEPTTFVDFNAKAELGEYSIPWGNVSALVFSSPKPTHQVKANGTRAMTLHLTGNEKLTLTGATFISDDKNKNGCFIGFSYKSSTHFTTDGGAEYDITLDKVRELRFGKDKSLTSIQIVSPSGTEYSGHLGATGVEGISRVGTFDLLFTVPFTSSAKSLTVD